MNASNEETAKNQHFGAAVRAGMKRSKVKVQDVVDELGVSRETVRLWRRGETVARDENLKKLAKMIGMNPADMRYAPGKRPDLPAMAGEHARSLWSLAISTPRARERMRAAFVSAFSSAQSKMAATLVAAVGPVQLDRKLSTRASHARAASLPYRRGAGPRAGMEKLSQAISRTCVRSAFTVVIPPTRSAR